VFDRGESFDQKRRGSVANAFKRRDSVSSDYNSRRSSVCSHRKSPSDHEPYCELSMVAKNANNNENDYKNGKVNNVDEYKSGRVDYKDDHRNGQVDYKENYRNGKVDYKDYKDENKDNKNDYKHKNGYNAYSAVDSVTRDINNFTNQVKTYNAFNSNKYRTPSFKKVSRNILEPWIPEDEEYEYENNEVNKNNGRKSSNEGQRKISLSPIREPTFDYDTLGILGLTSMMWSHSQAKQQDFLSKSFVRKPSISSHVM
jgi:hypothetical protein